jgi:hypothetical protein
MKSLNILVVGEKFKSISDNRYVLTWKDFFHYLYFTHKKNKSNHQLFIYAGQGLSKSEIDLLKNILGNHKLNCILMSHPESIQYCLKEDVHKHEEKNVLLTSPQKVGRHFYESYFLIDDDCAEMSDHVTGSHIQGALVAEAARQMVLAVSELYILPKEKKYRMSFVTNSSDFEYVHYLFPLECRMEMVVTHLRSGSDGNFSARAEISFFQNKILCAKSHFHFSAMNKDFIAEKESNLAFKTILKQIG